MGARLVTVQSRFGVHVEYGCAPGNSSVKIWSTCGVWVRAWYRNSSVKIWSTCVTVQSRFGVHVEYGCALGNSSVKIWSTCGV
ncbi:hypothetical protein RRG08_054070 [Elysia crispata]|uniref:Uncharacterized protein n=1 Tax=Elysia crispata TaxID=231223 RepID=A0AAE0ZEQ6_9GAST|nr:hypothetical protein RRG08_054070 [Elysia crispata]